MKETFVVLPGWAQTERSYKKLIEEAPENCQVVIAPHHEIIPNARVSDFIDNLLNFLHTKHITTANLIGHSLGGALALEFALHHPELIKSLYLVDSAGVYGEETLPQLLNNWLRNFFHRGRTKSLNAARNFLALLKRVRIHAKLAHYAFKADLREHGLKIKPPTTIIWGDKDTLTPLWQGQALHQAIPGSKLIILKEMDHDWILHSPELFWENVTPLPKVPD